MKWIRQITSCIFNKEEPSFPTHDKPRVYVPNCGWGVLSSFDATGSGMIHFEEGGGQIVRNWDHFFDLVEQIETRIQK